MKSIKQIIRVESSLREIKSNLLILPTANEVDKHLLSLLEIK